MSFRHNPPPANNQSGNAPNSLQVLLAALTGVAIGLSLTNFYKPKITHRVVATAPAPAQIAAAPAGQNGAPPGQKAFLDFSDFNLWPKLESRMNVLLMGVDSNGRDTERFKNCRSDTMMVASLDPKSHRVALVSLPRDSRVRIADNHGVEKINAAHALGGPELAVRTVSEDFAIPIDHYIVIDVQGLKKVFEVLGPVDVIVEKPMHYRDHAGRLNIALEPGVVTMDAEKLEEYVRFRHDAKGDIGRIERQQWFLRQVKKKLEEPQVLLKLPQLFKLASEYVRTDLSVEDMSRLAGFARGIQPGEIQTAMLPGVATTIYGGSYWLPDPEGAAILLHRLLGAPLAASTIADNTGTTIKTMATGTGSGDTATFGNTAGTSTATGIDAAASAEMTTRNDNVNAALAAAYTDKPLSVIVRYPRGCDALAKALEGRLVAKGMTVKYRQRGEVSECAHEQIVETSYRADDNMTAKLKGAVDELYPFAVSVNLDPRASADFVVVLSPHTIIAAPPPATDPSTEIVDAQNTAASPSLHKTTGKTINR